MRNEFSAQVLQGAEWVQYLNPRTCVTLGYLTVSKKIRYTYLTHMKSGSIKRSWLVDTFSIKQYSNIRSITCLLVGCYRLLFSHIRDTKSAGNAHKSQQMVHSAPPDGIIRTIPASGHYMASGAKKRQVFISCAHSRVYIRACVLRLLFKHGATCMVRLC